MKLDDFRDMIHATVKELVWIGTEISDDKQFINIKIAFGNRATVIPIKVEDIILNKNSCKNFVKLISKPLEAILEGRKNE